MKPVRPSGTAALVVIGRHSRRGVRRRVMAGPVCPVTVVREPVPATGD